jgi:uncharacterized protein
VNGHLPVGPVTESAEVRPFWDGARAGRLVLPYCPGCARYIWYPRSFCPRCGATEVQWREASGHGVVYSHTTVERGMGAFADVGRYVVVFVELDEGPRILTNLVDCDPDHVVIGAPVRVVFDRGADDAVLLRARLERA